jgi:glucose/arabinose dehydrogenase
MGKEMRRAMFLFALAFCVLPAGAQVLVDSNLEVESVVTGLTLPTSMAFLDDGDFLVSQKNDGRVRRVVGDVLQAGEVLDLHVNFLSERGLLNIVADPDVAHNGHVFLYYTESSTGADSSETEETLGNRVYRYTWNGSALVDPLLVLALPASTEFPGNFPGPHNGGVMAFGPDDRLYVLIGDLARGNFEAWSGQLQNNVAGALPNDTGVIFRVNRGGHAPPDNPFLNAADANDPMNRYFAYGVRNSFGIAFDPVSGELWQTENGPMDYDEVNRVFAGFNGGWIRIKGPIARDTEGEADLWVAPGSAYGDPQFSWVGSIAPTGIGFVHSRKLGCDLEHDMVVGDVNCGQLYRFELDPPRQTLVFDSPELQDLVADNESAPCADEMSEIVFGSGFGLITDLENGPDGRLYVVRYSAGAVARVAPRPGAVLDADNDEVDDTCDCDAANSTAYALPEEVPRLRLFGSSSTSLGWDSQQAAAGSGTVYTVITGDVSALRSDAGFSLACTLEAALPAEEASDARTPPVSEAFYYLVRAGNGCGTGSFGDGSGSPDPRDGLDTTLPPLCPSAAPSTSAAGQRRLPPSNRHADRDGSRLRAATPTSVPAPAEVASRRTEGAWSSPD